MVTDVAVGEGVEITGGSTPTCRDIVNLKFVRLSDICTYLSQ